MELTLIKIVICCYSGDAQTLSCIYHPENLLPPTPQDFDSEGPGIAFSVSILEASDAGIS